MKFTMFINEVKVLIFNNFQTFLHQSLNKTWLLIDWKNLEGYRYHNIYNAEHLIWPQLFFSRFFSSPLFTLTFQIKQNLVYNSM